jgi:hypothetical protein
MVKDVYLLTMHSPTRSPAPPPRTRRLLAMLTDDLPTARNPLWPGDNLVTPPEQPAVMPYLPHGT